MRDSMCIIGYGVKVAKLSPYVDPDKVTGLVKATYGVALAIDDGLAGDANALWNRIDAALIERDICYDMATFFGELVTSGHSIDCVANNRAEWFIYLPSCMPWEYGCGAPQTLEGAHREIFRALSPFLEKGVSPEEIEALCHPIWDIS